MAFVAGYKHDLFLSYAHPEAAWVEVFRKVLSQEFQERVGKPITFWQDSEDLRPSQNWTEEIENGITHAAAFVAIVSPLYHNSPWCGDELATFLDHYGALENPGEHKGRIAVSLSEDHQRSLGRAKRTRDCSTN